jgi:hypothetical protein
MVFFRWERNQSVGESERERQRLRIRELGLLNFFEEEKA